MSGLEQFIEPPKKKKKNPENYDDRCNFGKAAVGDVVYLPSDYDVKMTVAEIHPANRLAGHDQMITVHYFNAEQEIQTIKLLARTLVT